MTFDLNEVAQLPDTFSLEDFRVVCHISKRTARYFLRAGLIPCEISEKKTHCYTIRKQDLLDALKEYQKQPCKFALPEAFRDEKRQRKKQMEERIYSINCLPDKDLASPTLKKYYDKKLGACLDLLNCSEIERITGYTRKIIYRWCQQGTLRYVKLQPRLLVPKENLRLFLASKEYNGILHKSQVHLEDIHKIYRKIHRGE